MANTHNGISRMRRLPSIDEKIRKARDHFNSHGSVRTTLWVAERALARLGGLFYQAAEYHIAVKELDSYETGAVEFHKSFNCRRVDRDDMPALKRVLNSEAIERIHGRMNGSRGYILYIDGAAAGYLWATEKELKKEGVRPFYLDICPLPGNVYIYDGYTFPEFRKTGAFTILLGYLLACEKKEGATKAFFIFNMKNRAMRKVVSNEGFRVIGKTRARKYLWYIMMNSDDLRKVSRCSA